MDNREEYFAEDKARIREIFSLVSYPNSPDRVGDLPLAILAYTENIASLSEEGGLTHLLDDTTPYVSLAQLAYSDRFDLHKYLNFMEDAERKYGRPYVLDGVRKSPYLVPFLANMELYGKVEKHFSWYSSFKNRSNPILSEAVVELSNYAVSLSFDLRDQNGNCENLVLQLASIRNNEGANVFDLYRRATSSSGIRNMAMVAPFSAIAVHNDSIDEGDELRRMMAVWYIERLSKLGNLGGAMDRIIHSPTLFEIVASDRPASDVHSRLSRNWTNGSKYREIFLREGCWRYEARIPLDIWGVSYVTAMCNLARRIDEDTLRDLRRTLKRSIRD